MAEKGETPKIVLDNRSLGISPDEYAGGSYYFAEGIETQHSTKGFRLGNKTLEVEINRRANGNIVAIGSHYDLSHYGDYRKPLIFTKDGVIESYTDYIGMADGSYGDYGGGLYRGPNTDVKNGIAFGDYIVQVRGTFIDLITKGATGKFGMFLTNIVTTPDLTATGDWTVGSGWTLGATGAVHTVGQTGTLTQTIPTVNTKKYRVTINATFTAGTLSVKFGAGSGYGFSGNDNWRLTTPMTSAADNEVLTITPSSTFDGTIHYVEINEYTATIETDKVTLTTATSHPLLYSQGYLYIGSGDKLDVVSTTTRTKETFSLIDESHEIVAITEVGQSIILWTSDGRNGKQYYRDRVSDAVSEVIDWKGLDITAANSDETVSYVITGGRRSNQRCFAVEGYTRTLLAERRYDGRNNSDDWNGYHQCKRFDFYTDNGSSIAVHNKNIYVPTKGTIYTYGTEIPGGQRSRQNSIKYTTATDKPIVAMNVINDALFFAYQSVTSGTTYNTLGISNKLYPNTTGYLVTNPLFRDSFGTDKSLNKLRIGYKGVPSEYGDIKIYAIVDDYYFYTFTVSGITNTPSVGDKYSFISGKAFAEVISTDISTGAGTITMKAYDNIAPSLLSLTPTGTLTKVSGDGDTSISYTYVNNMVLLKTITTEQIEYKNDLLFSDDFVNAHMPNRHKIQFVIELNTSLPGYGIAPECWDVSFISDPVNNNLG